MIIELLKWAKMLYWQTVEGIGMERGNIYLGEYATLTGHIAQKPCLGAVLFMQAG
jgi:hypothetical protein